MLLWKKRFSKVVERMRGQRIPLSFRLWNGTEVDLSDNKCVTINIPTVTALRHFFSPTLGTLSRAYVEGEIDVEGRATDVVDVAARLTASGSPSGKDMRRRTRMVHHNRKMDAASIAYHYDVSNEFYSHWLDSGMVYSCAYFRNEDDPLEVAQEQKIDHILCKLRVRPGDRLLDIG